MGREDRTLDISEARHNFQNITTQIIALETITGVYHPDGREIRFDGVSLVDKDPGAIREAGVEMIYQDRALSRMRDVASWSGGRVDLSAMATPAAGSHCDALGACPRNGGLWWRRLLESDSVCL